MHLRKSSVRKSGKIGLQAPCHPIGVSRHCCTSNSESPPHYRTYGNQVPVRWQTKRRDSKLKGRQRFPMRRHTAWLAIG